MGVNRIYVGDGLPTSGDVVQVLGEVGVELDEAERVGKVLNREDSLRETSRISRQEGIKPGSLPIIIDTFTRYDQTEGLNQRIFDQINHLNAHQYQVYENMSTERDLTCSRAGRTETRLRKFSIFRRKPSVKRTGKDIETETRGVLYSLLLVYRNRLSSQDFDILHVEVQAEVQPHQPLTNTLFTSTQYHRWSALKAVLSEAEVPLRRLDSRVDTLPVDRADPPLLRLHGGHVTNLALCSEAGLEKQKLRESDIPEVVDKLARIGSHLETEIKTVLEDNLVGTRDWTWQVYAVWTIPLVHRRNTFTFNLIIVNKDWSVYKYTANPRLMEDDIVLNEQHLDCLKLIAVRKLKEKFKEVDLRVELPGTKTPRRRSLLPNQAPETADWMNPSPSASPATLELPVIPVQGSFDVPNIPEMLYESGPSNYYENPRNEVYSRVRRRRISSCAEPPRVEHVQATVHARADRRTDYFPQTSVTSVTSTTSSRRASIISDMKDVISSSGKRLSLIAENQGKALQILVENINNQKVSRKEKAVYAFICICILLLLSYFLNLAWTSLLLIRDGFLKQLSNLFADQESQISQLNVRLENVEQMTTQFKVVEQLGTRLERVEQLVGQTGGQLTDINNQLKSNLAKLDKLTAMTTGVEKSLNAIQSQSGWIWSPFTKYLPFIHQPTSQPT